MFSCRYKSYSTGKEHLSRDSAWNREVDRWGLKDWGNPGLKWGGVACCLVAVLLMCLSAALAPKPEPEDEKMTFTIVTDQNANSSTGQQGVPDNAGQTQPLV
jgi:hypothetical protein